MHHVCKPNLRFMGLLAIVFAAIMIPSAAAYPVLQDESNFVANTTKAPLVIPYLSHGVGVDQSRYSGTPSRSHTQDAEQSFIGSAGSDAFGRAVDRHALLVDGLDATAVSTAAVRPDNRAGIRGVGGNTVDSHSTAVRPDDRSGIRGIGGNAVESQSSAVRPDDRAGLRGLAA